MSEILMVRNLNQYFPFNGDKNTFTKFLSNINFSVKEGEIFGIAGESGCGKSTLGKCLAGLFNYVEGEIIFNDRNIIGMPANDKKEMRKELQIIFQNPRSALNMNMDVYSLIKEAVKIKNSNHNINKQINNIINMVKLEDKKESLPSELSGGERRRAALGRILSVEPSLIIADEPVSSLDVSYKGLIVELLINYKREYNSTTVFISHDLKLLKSICDRIGIMFKGEIVEIFNNKINFDEYYFHHPYTQELFNASKFFTEGDESIRKNMTFVDAETKEIKSPGCPYYYRCYAKHKDKHCKNYVPQLTQINDNQKIACYGIKNEKRVE